MTVAVIAEFGVYAFEKGEEFLVAVVLGITENSPGGRIVSGRQRKAPV